MSATQRTVLVVDDDRQILSLVEKMLRPQGVTVLSSNRPSEALQICEEQTVHVLISDVMMPEMDGGRLAERFLKLLQKPFFPSVLVQELRTLLEGIG
jgi:CheY-like chemotaxis protein